GRRAGDEPVLDGPAAGAPGKGDYGARQTRPLGRTSNRGRRAVHEDRERVGIDVSDDKIGPVIPIQVGDREGKRASSGTEISLGREGTVPDSKQNRNGV